MPQFTAITRRRVSVTLPSGSNLVSIGGVEIALPAEAGQGIDVSAADVGGDVWAVCIGIANDHVYLCKLSTGQAEDVSGEQARSSWIDEHGVVSWVPESDPYVVRSLGTSETTPSLDTKHPAWPVPGVIEQWGGVTVTDIQRSDDWEVASEAHDPNRLVVARYQGGDVMEVWRGISPKPARVQAHEDGSCTVCIQIPAGIDEPVFVPSSAFTRYVKPAVTYPPFTPNPNRFGLAIDNEPGGIEIGNAQWPQFGKDGILHDAGRPSELGIHVALARQYRSPLIVYQDTDTPDWTLFHEVIALVPKDVAALPGFQLYPRHGESVEIHSARVELQCGWADLEFDAYMAYPAGFCAPGQRGERTLHQVRMGLRAVANAAIRHPKLRLGDVFAWDRSSSLGPDGVSRVPEIRDDVAAWRASLRNYRDYPTAAELLPAKPDAPKPPTPKPTVPPKPAPTPVSIFKELLLMTAGALTLMHSKFVPSTVLPGRFNYKNDDGSFLSVNAKGEVSTSRSDHANTAFSWSKGAGKCWVWPDADPFAVKHTFLVDEQD